MPNLGIIFLTGLSVGGFSCMAVQGGLLASTIATREKEDVNAKKGLRHSIGPTAAFVTAKLLIYTLLGFVLGAFGGALDLSPTTRTIMQVAAGVYMIAVALDLLQIHPIFHYAILQLPRFLTRRIRSQAKSKDIFAPAILGTMTVFIPCGTTLAMEALAISSGSAVSGAAVMAAFILGTIPLFFGLGILTTIIGDSMRLYFFKLAGVIVIYLGLTSINGALNVLGVPSIWQILGNLSPVEIHLGNRDLVQATGITDLPPVVNGEQQVQIQVLGSGYEPTSVTVRDGIPVRITLTSSGGYSCASDFTIPQYGINKLVPQNGTATVDFTPSGKGQVRFTCIMGMYSGVINVI